jgi:ankyrin repeat protein
MLLAKGANPVAVDANGQTAAMHAMEGGSVCEGCYLMLKNMAKNVQQDDDKKESSKSKH